MGTRTQDPLLNTSSITSYPFEDNNSEKRQPAREENTLARELQNLLNASGQTSTQSNTSQILNAINTLIANSNLYSTSGTANAIILTTRTLNSANANSTQVPNLYFDEDGVKYEFDAIFSNTGAVTLEIAGFVSACNVVDFAGNTLLANVIVAGSRYTLKRDKANNRFIILNPTPTLQAQQRITLSYASPTVINYTAGGFIFDDFSGSGFVSAGSVNITDFYPAPANNTGYYLFAVKNLTTNESKVIPSDSKTSPTLPAGFTKKKYIGALMTDGIGQIRAGTYIYGEGVYEFYYHTQIEDVGLSNPPIGTNNYPISVPLGNNIIAYTVGMANTGTIGSDALSVNFGSTNEDFTGLSVADACTVTAIGDASRYAKTEKHFPTSTRQVKVQIFASQGARNFRLHTRGWKEYI